MGGKYRVLIIFWDFFLAHEHVGAAIGRKGDALLLLDNLL